MAKRKAQKVGRTRGKTAAEPSGTALTAKAGDRRGTAISVPISEVRKRLAELVNRVAYGAETVILEKHGKPAAMLVPVEK